MPCRQLDLRPVTAPKTLLLVLLLSGALPLTSSPPDPTGDEDLARPPELPPPLASPVRASGD
jgi:hypothetical protein